MALNNQLIKITEREYLIAFRVFFFSCPLSNVKYLWMNLMTIILKHQLKCHKHKQNCILIAYFCFAISVYFIYMRHTMIIWSLKCLIFVSMCASFFVPNFYFVLFCTHLWSIECMKAMHTHIWWWWRYFMHLTERPVCPSEHTEFNRTWLLWLLLFVHSLHRWWIFYFSLVTVISFQVRMAVAWDDYTAITNWDFCTVSVRP